MAATFTGPLNWGPDPNATLTASKLASWVGGTLISNIGTGEFVSGSQPFFVGLNEPSGPLTGLRWRDTTLMMTRVYDGARFQPESQGRILFNTDITLAIGSVVAFGATDSSIARCNTSRYGGVMGITATLIGQLQFGLVRTAGLGPCLVTGTCTAGDVMIAFGTGGVGGAIASVPGFPGGNAGYTGANNRPGAEVAFAMLNNAGVAGLVTCLVIR